MVKETHAMEFNHYSQSYHVIESLLQIETKLLKEILIVLYFKQRLLLCVERNPDYYVSDKDCCNSYNRIT